MENIQLTYILPPPEVDGSVSVEKSLVNRRSRRRFQNRAITKEQLSQILWAAYGVANTAPGYARLRTAPSAGASYPLEIYVAAGNVNEIERGVYKYISEDHTLIRTIGADVRRELCAAALGQKMVEDAPATIIYCAVFERITGRYGRRGLERYVCMDVGHSAQNVYLQAEALLLGTCAIGAFSDDAVSQILQLPQAEEPLYLMPVGYA